MIEHSTWRDGFSVADEKVAHHDKKKALSAIIIRCLHDFVLASIRR
jgi:hypothetical protein